VCCGDAVLCVLGSSIHYHPAGAAAVGATSSGAAEACAPSAGEDGYRREPVQFFTLQGSSTHLPTPLVS
jgi:hypothetical protein